jgi:diaminohydroxyphosphoribosylaminopyrimidine deaminase/5-amino-6-(5-phosphoribosylamino)uracil reductase
VNLEQLLRILGQRNIVSVIAEGGPTVLSSLFVQELVDEVHAYIAPRVLGPLGVPLFERSPFFEPATLRETAAEVLAPDVLIRGYTGAWTP